MFPQNVNDMPTSSIIMHGILLVTLNLQTLHRAIQHCYKCYTILRKIWKCIKADNFGFHFLLLVYCC